ncbi:hypothetical protein LGV61_12480 [Desulfurispirillum indicum]|uniref:hypothetical protein n=1 Tax=Desulfurispirillum indicum TaxID=936456 RepID=UPI001CF9E176|nr:hypothetical protein [Desulfurispirillum indicum]UCZ56528.1 hypothetical protein LGV61_12480 [Desulfurispirillum indicum]
MQIKSSIKKIPLAIFWLRLARNLYAELTGWRKRKAPQSAHIVDVKGYKSIFWGYYDHSPFQPGNESHILVHANNWPAWRLPSCTAPTSILLVDWASGEIVRNYGDTFAWNWQQGARLMWLDESLFIYNIYDPESQTHRARVMDVNGTEKALLPIPVQEWDGKSKVYSLSYDALDRIRPDYGYRNKRGHESSETQSGAIECFDLESGEHRVMLHVDSLLPEAQERHPGARICRAKLNHIMASPDAKHVVFLFRYFADNDRITDMYLMDANTKEYRCLVPDQRVSHYCWLNNQEVLATLTDKHGQAYYKVPIEGVPTFFWRQADGHPVMLGDNYFITDTYPDKQRMRHLLAVPLETPERAVKLESFPEPLLLQGETRCDLHPSVSPSGKWLQVDCALGHKRIIAILKKPLLEHCLP